MLPVKGDEAGLGVLDDGGAEAGALAGAEVDDTVGEACLLKQREEFCSDGGGVDRRLEDDGVTGDDSGGGHAGHDGERKVPGRD